MMKTQLDDASFRESNVVNLNLRMYKIVMIGPNNEIVYVREFHASSDQRASNIAENMYNGLELDLCEKDRYVKNMPAERRC